MSHSGRRGTTFFVSLVLHAGLALSVVVLPLFLTEALPSPKGPIICLSPLPLPAPPPPLPPPGSTRLPERHTRKPVEAVFVAPPVESELVPDDASFLGTGDFGGDGVIGVNRDGIGSVMSDLPANEPPPPPRVVRIGNGIRAPRVVRRVEPAYPAIALAARLSATVQLEAEVDARGEVAHVHVERGHPLFDEAALAAVRQWRYQPLLLNGEPTGFILSVTVAFSLTR